MKTFLLVPAPATPKRPRQPRRSLRASTIKRLALVAGLSLFGGSLAEAQIVTRTWTGVTNNNWSNAGNWTGGVPASSIDLQLIFPDKSTPAAYTTANNIATTPFLANSLSFTNTLTATVNGSLIQLSQSSVAGGSLLPTINVSGAGAVTFNTMPVVLGANTTINKTGAGSLTFTSVISETGGARSLTVGSGTGGQINLDGVNTFTGGLVVNGNIVRFNNEGALFGSFGSVNGSVTLNGGEIRPPTSTLGIVLAPTRQIILGGGALNTNTAGFEVAGVLSGTNLIKTGAGTLIISNAANTYSGNTQIQQGTLQIKGSANLPTSTIVNFGSGANNGTLDLNGTNQQVAGLTVIGTTAASQIIGNSSTTADSILTFSSAGSSTFGGTLQNVLGTGTRALGLVVSAGTLNLSGTNTYTNGTTVNSGATLILGAGGTTGSLVGNVANAGTLGINRSDNVAFAGNISGGGSFAKSGTGVAALTGTNTFNTVAVSAGTLRVQPSSLGGTPAVTVASGSTLEVFNPTATTSIPVTSLGLGADSLSTNTINVLLNGDPSGAALAVANNGGLVSNGTTTINVGNGAIPLTLGLKSLISYVGAIAGTSNAAPDFGFVLGTLPSRALGSLVTSNPGLIQLNITSIDTIKWTGTDGTNPSYWDINTTTNWALNSNATATNYLETAPPGDTVTFDASGAVKTIDLRTIVSPAAVTVNTSGGNYTFIGTGGIAGAGGLVKQGAGTLFITNTGANSSTGGTTVNAGTVHVGNGTDTSSLTGNVALAATTKLELNPGTTAITIAGDVTGAGAVEVQTNTAILTGLGNTYGGGTTIASGATLQIGNGTVSGSLPTTGLVNNGTLAFNPGALGYQFSGNLTSGALSILGTRTTTLTGTGNTFTGGTTVASGATLQIGDGVTSSGSLAGNVTLSGILNFRPVTNITFGGDISGTGGRVGGLTGSTLLNGALSYTGVTTVGSGATLQLGDGTKAVAITGNVTNNGTLALNVTTGNLAYGGVISGAGAVTVLGGEVTLNAANTYTGQTSIATGATIRAGIVNSLSASTILDVASGATYDANSFSSRSAGLTGSGNVTLGTTPATLFTINSTNTNTFNGIISGQGGISRLSGGIQILGNNNTYTGSTNIQGDNSQIRIAVDNALPVGTTLTFGGGTNLNVIFDLNGKNQSVAALTGATTGAGTIFVQNNSGAGLSTLTITNGTGTFGITPTRARIRDNDGTAIGGQVGLTITGGTTTFVDSHTYTGPTTISGGTYQVGKANAVAANSAFTISSPGTLNLATFAAGLADLTGNGTVTGTTGILTVTTGNFSGLLTGGIGLIKGNAGTFTVSGTANDFTGTLQVNNGTLALTNLANSGAGSNGNGAIRILSANNTAATLNYTGTGSTTTRSIDIFATGAGPGDAIISNTGTGALTIGGVSRSGAVDVGLKTLALQGTNNGLNTVAGVITNGTDVLNVSKAGTGTWVLSGTNTYTGTTTVSAGKLIVNSTGSINGTSGVTINGGELNYNSSTALTQPVTLTAGKLSGTGTISTPVTVGAGASLSPGNSPGIQPLGGALTWSNGGAYTWEVKSWSATPTVGLDYDQIQVSAGLNIGGLTAGAWPTNTFKIDINGLDGANVIGGVSGFDNTLARSWTILTSTGLTGQTFNSNLFTLDTTNFATANSLGGGSFNLTSDGSNLVLNFAPAVTGATGTTYTLAVAAGTLNILKGGRLSATSTITNTGTGAADTLTYTTLGATSTAPGTASVTGSSNGGPLNNAGANAVQNLVITGVANGSATITASVASATNTTLATPASLSGSAGTINVVVGNAGFASGNSSTTFGTALIAATPISGTPYTNLESSTTAGTQIGTLVPALGTTATILSYTNSTGSDNSVSMQWRTRTASEASTNSGDNGTRSLGYLISDVVNLTGMINGAGTQTDLFVLQMSYQDTLLVTPSEASTVNESSLYIASLNGSSWVNATDLNIAPDGLGSVKNYSNDFDGAGGNNAGSWANFVAQYGVTAANLNQFVGSWGVDQTSNQAWAILDHNSEFAVIPEPSTLVLGGLALLGFAGVGLRRRRINATHEETV